MFLEGQLGHVYSLADNCVLVNARADVCDYLKDWCDGAAAFFRERIIDDFSPRYREMLDALDLRVLILPQAESVVKEQLSALKKLWIWSCRSGRVDLPADFAVMDAQHRAVIEALTAAMAEPRSEFKRRWEDQQHGTVMKDLLTMSRFYEGNEAIATATTTPPPAARS